MRWIPLFAVLLFPLAAQTRMPPQEQPAVRKDRPAASHTRSEKPGATHSRQGGPAPAASDAQIEREFRARLAKSKVAADKFTIHVQGGVATLEGNTDVVQHKGAATRMAKTAGAVTVVNKIKISDAARDRASRNLAQGRRRVQVKRSEVPNR